MSKKKKTKLVNIEELQEHEEKEELIVLLKEANEIFITEHPEVNTKVSAHWFRNYLKGINSKYSEKFYVRLWGTFGNFKKEAFTEIKREDIQIIKKSKIISKTYFVSSIIEGAPVNEKFMRSIKTFCKINKAELVLLISRGVKISDFFDYKIREKYQKYFATEYLFNSNLVAKDFILNPQMIKPTTGLQRFGQKQFSIITASPKQFMQTIPTKKGALPHVLYTTGTISNPKYRLTRVGSIAQQDNLIGGLVVEVIDNKLFHIRPVQSDNKNGFYDLDNYYCSDIRKKTSIEAMICGDLHYGAEDEIAIKATQDQISLLKPKQVFFHDTFDGKSVNPHIEKDMVTKLQRPLHQQTLENELNYLGKKLLKWLLKFPKQKFVIVPSNHDDFVDRYLTQRKFVDDEQNIYLSCDLFRSLIELKNPVEYYLKKNFPKLNKIKFLKIDQPYEICGIEVNVHGHIGSNGSRGSTVNMENTYGKCIIGHSHSPQIFREVYVVGCNCQLIQDYNKGGSSWLTGNVIIHKNGTRQLIISIEGKWKK